MIGKILFSLLGCNLGGFVVYASQQHPQTIKEENGGAADVIKCIQSAYDPLFITNLGISQEVNFDVTYKKLIISNETQTLLPQQFIKSLTQSSTPSAPLWEQWVGDNLNLSQTTSALKNTVANHTFDWGTDFIDNATLQIKDDKAELNVKNNKQINKSQVMNEVKTDIQYSIDNKVVSNDCNALYDYITSGIAGQVSGKITSGSDLTGIGSVKFDLLDANRFMYPTNMFWKHLAIPFNLSLQNEEHSVDYSNFDLSNIICVTENNWENKTITFGLNKNATSEEKEIMNDLIKNKVKISVYYKIKDSLTGSYKNLITSFNIDSLDSKKEIQIGNNPDLLVTSIKSDEVNNSDFFISQNETSKISSNCDNVAFDENGSCVFTRPEISSVSSKNSAGFSSKALACFTDDELVNDFFVLYDAYGNEIIFEAYYSKYINIKRSEDEGSFTIDFFNNKNESIFSQKITGFKPEKNLDIIMDEQNFTVGDLQTRTNCDKLLLDNGYPIYEKYISRENNETTGECILDCYNETELEISYKIINLIPYYIIQKEIPKSLAKIKPSKITKEVLLENLVEESVFFKDKNKLDVLLTTSKNKLTADIKYLDFYSKENIGLQYKYQFVDGSKSITFEIISVVSFVFALLLFFIVKIFLNSKRKKLNH